MQEHRPPSNDAGNEFCVAWWTKGGCFPNCGRRLTHRAFASAAERTRLLAYVREHLQAPAAAAAGGSPEADNQKKRKVDHITEAEAALGKLALELERAMVRKGWHQLVTELRGQSNVTPTVRNIPHRAGRLLEHLRRRGASVPMATPPWDLERRDMAMQRGSHQSSHGELWEGTPTNPRQYRSRGPRYGPVYMAKIDIADGFYRVWLQIADIPQLGVALPNSPGREPLVAFPLALPMGWVESPPYFTALTETSCDLANAMLARNVDARLHSQHRLETVAATSPDGHEHNTRATFQPPTRRPTRPRPPLAAVDVYVDDFLLLAQTRPQQRRVLRAALSAIDDVFRPVTAGDPVCRQEPASRKKMLKGDAHWSTQKRMLGWDIDTEGLTLNLPPHRIERLQEALTWLRPPRKRLPRTKWHQLLGELRSMSPALPGARGLFSALQAALSHGDGRRPPQPTHLRYRSGFRVPSPDTGNSLDTTARACSNVADPCRGQ
ncbi:adenylate kinase [Fragilaria crotonensis]|nr:adenylate kinase [Fragilaria crotonensis]